MDKLHRAWFCNREKCKKKKVVPSLCLFYDTNQQVTCISNFFRCCWSQKYPNGALSRLRQYVPTRILINIYHAVFASHTRYASQVWGLCDNSVTHRILTLQNLVMRLITFSAPRKSTTPLYAELSILKFFDQVKVMNILYVHKYLNGNLPEDCLETLKFNKTKSLLCN